MGTPLAPAAGTTRPAATAQTAERQKMQAVAKQFEAVFLRQMIGAMRSADVAEGMFDSSAGQQFRDMADARTADSMAETGGFGVAALLMRQYDTQHGAPGGTQAKSVTNTVVNPAK